MNILNCMTVLWNVKQWKGNPGTPYLFTSRHYRALIALNSSQPINTSHMCLCVYVCIHVYRVHFCVCV